MTACPGELFTAADPTLPRALTAIKKQAKSSTQRREGAKEKNGDDNPGVKNHGKLNEFLGKD